MIYSENQSKSTSLSVVDTNLDKKSKTLVLPTICNMAYEKVNFYISQRLRWRSFTLTNFSPNFVRNAPQGIDLWQIWLFRPSGVHFYVEADR